MKKTLQLKAVAALQALATNPYARWGVFAPQRSVA